MGNVADRVLTVRVIPGVVRGFRWRLLDSDDFALAESVLYPAVLDAEQAARDAFGGGLGEVVGIDLETHSGRTERIR